MKAICIIRTSTDRQRIEEQTAEVVQMAKNDGYTDDNIIVVGECGASAIKLDEAYKRNLDRLYFLLDTEPVSCVYAWAIDRIGRNEEVLMKLKNTLINRKIQLKIKNPTLTLFNDINGDLSVNTGVELAFSLYATMAKQEMEQKKERFARGKRQNGKAEKYNGGTIPFGYSVIDGKYAVNVPESLIVRRIYNMFATGKYSLKTLVIELKKRDIRRRDDKYFTLPQLRLVIYNSCYIGQSDGAKIQRYPRIISDDLYNKVREILASNKTNKSQESKHSYFGNKLIRCPECGYHYSANTRIYRCVKHSNNKAWSIGKADYTACHNDICIAITTLDSLLLDVARRKHTQFLYDDMSKRNQYIETENAELMEKIAGLDVIISKFTARKRKIRDVYLSDDDYTEEEYKTAIQKLNDEFDGYRSEKMSMEERIRRNREILNSDNNVGDIYTDLVNMTADFLNSADERRYADLVKQYVRDVRLARYDTTDRDRQTIDRLLDNFRRVKKNFRVKIPETGTRIEIVCNDGTTEQYVYYSSMRNNDITHYYQLGPDGITGGAQPMIIVERYGDICKINRTIKPDEAITLFQVIAPVIRSKKNG